MTWKRWCQLLKRVTSRHGWFENYRVRQFWKYIHEIFIPKEDYGILYWKKASSDNECAEAKIVEPKMQKRFKLKEQHKDDVLQENLDDDSESKTDDGIEEEASCILFVL